MIFISDTLMCIVCWKKKATISQTRPVKLSDYFIYYIYILQNIFCIVKLHIHSSNRFYFVFVQLHIHSSKMLRFVLLNYINILLIGCILFLLNYIYSLLKCCVLYC